MTGTMRTMTGTTRTDDRDHGDDEDEAILQPRRSAWKQSTVVLSSDDDDAQADQASCQGDIMSFSEEDDDRDDEDGGDEVILQPRRSARKQPIIVISSDDEGAPVDQASHHDPFTSEATTVQRTKSAKRHNVPLSSKGNPSHGASSFVSSNSPIAPVQRQDARTNMGDKAISPLKRKRVRAASHDDENVTPGAKASAKRRRTAPLKDRNHDDAADADGDGDNDASARPAPPLPPPHPRRRWQGAIQSPACQAIIREAGSKAVRSAHALLRLRAGPHDWVHFTTDLTDDEWGVIMASAFVTKAHQQFLEEGRDIVALSHISQADATALVNVKHLMKLPSGPGVYNEGVVDMKDKEDPRFVAVFGVTRGLQQRAEYHTSRWRRARPDVWAVGSGAVPWAERRDDLHQVFVPVISFRESFDWREAIGRPAHWKPQQFSEFARIMGFSVDKAIFTLTSLFGEIAMIAVHGANLKSKPDVDIPFPEVCNRSPGGEYLLLGRALLKHGITLEANQLPTRDAIQPADLESFLEHVLPLFGLGLRCFTKPQYTWSLNIPNILYQLLCDTSSRLPTDCTAIDRSIFHVDFSLCQEYGITQNNILARAFHLPSGEPEPTTPQGLEGAYAKAGGRCPALKTEIDHDVGRVKEAFIYERDTGRLAQGPETFQPMSLTMTPDAEAFTNLFRKMMTDDQRRTSEAALAGQGAENLRHLQNLPRLFYQVGLVRGKLAYLWPVCGNAPCQSELRTEVTLKLMEMVAAYKETTGAVMD